MGLKSLIAFPLARRLDTRRRKWAKSAIPIQEQTLLQLIKTAATTSFGKDHDFESIRGYADFKKKVPIRDYEAFRTYIDAIRDGKSDILWPGKPTYFAKTSGTTSGVKYIPMTKESTPHHVDTARDSVFSYMAETHHRTFLDGKMLYLSGSPEMTDVNGILTGRLSGIVNHQIPAWLKGNKLPSHEINCIEEWEDKVRAIVRESATEDVRLIGGIPPWVQMYYEELLRYTGKATVKEVFPNLSIFVYGGVNFEPYRAQLDKLVGKSLPSVETFPASEGFFAYQDKHPTEGLLLNVNAGIFFEFVPVGEIHDENPTRLSLAEVSLNTAYALIVSTNAGLWAYSIGDTVEFVSLEPPRIIVAGRIKHFISAFGEHVIGKEVDQAMLEASRAMDIQINEFTIAPQVNPREGLPYHEWFVELAGSDVDKDQLESLLDTSMQHQNIYYKDLIQGKILRPVRVTLLQKNAFRNYMQSMGKLGGQNKVPRLSNDRKIADALGPFKL